MAVPDLDSSGGPTARALVLGIRLFRIVGGLLLLYFVMESLLSLTDLRLRNPTAELRFASQMTDRIPLGLLGLALLLCHPRFFRQRAELVFMRIIASLPLFLAIAYALLIPMIMISSANYFRNATYGLQQQVEDQVKKVRAVREATLNLSPDQQQGMVDRYNQANPKKQPVDLPGFLKTLNDEVKASEARLEQERRSALGAQQQSLYMTQLVQSLKILAGAAAFFFTWRVSGWARPAGQAALGTELGASRRRG